MKIKTLSKKLAKYYEIRKEHVTYNDGRTEDRVVAYDLNGNYIGTVKQAEAIIASQLAKSHKVTKRKHD